MHSAPSVSYPVGRSAFAGRAALALGAAGLAVIALWSLQAPFGWRQLAALAALLACAGLAWDAWRRSPAGLLRWDGLEWTWEESGLAAAGQPELALDLQSRLLLRWRPEQGGARWLWLERESAASHWDALRRAVYSRANAPIPAFSRGGKERQPAGKPPAAEQ